MAGGGCIFELTRFHGPNKVRCDIVSGDQETPLIGVYLPPSTLYHLLDLEENFYLFIGRYPIVLGNLNAEIGRLRNPHNQHVSDFMASFVLVDLMGHFYQRLFYHHLQTWFQFFQVRVIRYQCEYYMRSNRRLFETVGIWDPRNFSSEHFALHARLLWRPTRYHGRYL